VRVEETIELMEIPTTEDIIEACLVADGGARAPATYDSLRMEGTVTRIKLLDNPAVMREVLLSSTRSSSRRPFSQWRFVRLRISLKPL
jgi:hypothetical protein